MALILACGPRMCTQGIAWLSMLANNVPDQGLLEGIEQTFNGENPCKLCCSIKNVENNKTAPQEERREIFVALKNPLADHALPRVDRHLNWHSKNFQYSYKNPSTLFRPPIRV